MIKNIQDHVERTVVNTNDPSVENCFFLSVFFLVCGVVLARELSNGTTGVKFWCVLFVDQHRGRRTVLVHGDDVLGARFLPRSTDKYGLNRTSPDLRTVEYIIS